jgi:hypothetical protein
MKLPVIVTSVLAAVGVQAAKVHFSPCAGVSGATAVQVADLSCATARQAILTYEGAPAGCVTGRRCVQSGTAGDQALFDDCRRANRQVACTVYLHDPRGHVKDPRVDGIVLRSRFDRGFVSFTDRHRLGR